EAQRQQLGGEQLAGERLARARGHRPRLQPLEVAGRGNERALLRLGGVEDQRCEDGDGSQEALLDSCAARGRRSFSLARCGSCGALPSRMSRCSATTQASRSGGVFMRLICCATSRYVPIIIEPNSSLGTSVRHAPQAFTASKLSCTREISRWAI